jgi:hypothetical protein
MNVGKRGVEMKILVHFWGLIFAVASLPVFAASFELHPILILDHCTEKGRRCVGELVSPGDISIPLDERGAGVWRLDEMRGDVHYSFAIQVRAAGQAGHQLVTSTSVSTPTGGSAAAHFSTYALGSDDLHPGSTGTDPIPVGADLYDSYIMIDNYKSWPNADPRRDFSQLHRVPSKL